MMSKYLQVVWLYVIGIMIIFVGVYLLMLKSGPGSFIVMLVGLGISALGAAHGRKMRVSGELGMEDIMRQKGFDVRNEQDNQPVNEEPAAPEEEQPAEEAASGEEPREGRKPIFFKRFPSRPASAAADIEMEDIKSGKLAPTEADVIELVCRSCGAENDEKNFFCFNCGAKLRRKSSSEAKLKEPPLIPVEPGSIKMVGDKRVAKVVICPKCNSSNKESDKFCYNCGKKLRTEHARGKKEE